jgi:20S proteasome subunit beta 2
LGADTRATSGPIVADKNCEKIHYISERIWCCGAGTAADTEYTTKLISNKMELHRLNSNGRPVRVTSAMTQLKHYLFQYQGHIGAALILGGIDPVDGIQLYSIYPHGSVDRLPYCTMGSGSLAAMSVFESSFQNDMNKQDAINLASRAILSGIFNDLGSGSNVDILVIPKNPQESVEYLRGYQRPNDELLSSSLINKGSLIRPQVPPGITRIITEEEQLSFHNNDNRSTIRKDDQINTTTQDDKEKTITSNTITSNDTDKMEDV